MQIFSALYTDMNEQYSSDILISAFKLTYYSYYVNVQL